MRADLSIVKPDIKKCGEYLGFGMAGCDATGYYGIPLTWDSTEVLWAQSEPELRKRIWRWWNLVGCEGGAG